MDAWLELCDVHFSYPGMASSLLRSISFSVLPGEIVGLLGPNGVGKTTTLKIAAGLLRPKMGKVFHLGRDASKISRKELARCAAYVPPTLRPSIPMSVKEVVALGRLPHTKGFFVSKGDKERVASAMALLEVSDLADRPFEGLSSGEQKRVLIARAIAQEPKVLLLDEPTANLDIAHAMSVLGCLRRIAKSRPLAALASIHDLNLAVQFCDRIALLQSGQIIAIGEPEQVMRYPLLKRVFGCEMYIGRNEITGHLFMVPMTDPQVQ